MTTPPELAEILEAAAQPLVCKPMTPSPSA